MQLRVRSKEVGDFYRSVILEDLEFLSGETAYRNALFVGHHHLDADQRNPVGLVEGRRGIFGRLVRQRPVGAQGRHRDRDRRDYESMTRPPQQNDFSLRFHLSFPFPGVDF